MSLIAPVGLLAWVLFGCGTPPDATATTETVSPTVLVIPDLHLDLPVSVPTAVAVRETTSTVQVESAAPFDCAVYVNSLPFSVNDPEPAREAYRVTASCRGWDPVTIAKWEHFIVDDVMNGESRYCPNIRGGAQMSGVGCDLAVNKFGVPLQGTKSDSGIMQLIRLWYQPGGPLCEAEGLCSSDEIISTPWASFNAGLFAVEYDGSHPWCFNDWARSYHRSCSTITRSWP